MEHVLLSFMLTNSSIVQVAKNVKENPIQFSDGDCALQEAWELFQNCGDSLDAWSMVVPNTEVTGAEERIEGTDIITDHELPPEPIPKLANGDDPPSMMSAVCVYELIGENVRPLLHDV